MVHDVTCYGYYIKHPDIGKLLFATDTELIRQNFSKIKLNHMLVEANYSKELINNGKYNRDHVLTGHMEIDTTCTFLHTNDSPQLLNVVLLHLSDSNSDELQFIQKVKESVRSGVNVYAADKGLEVNLNLCPFMD